MAVECDKLLDDDLRNCFTDEEGVFRSPMLAHYLQ